MIIGYINSQEGAEVVELQRQSMLHYAKANHLSIDMFYDKSLSELKSDVLSEQKTVLFANAYSLGNTLEKIQVNMEDLYKAKFNSVFVQEGFTLPASTETEKIIQGIGFALCIRNSVASVSTKKALSERSEQGMVLGRRTGSVNKKYKLDKYAEVIKENIDNGMSCLKIAEQLNVSPITLNNYLKTHPELGRIKNTRHGVLADADDQIRSMLANGQTKTAIAKKFKVTIATLFKKLHQMGVETNRESVIVQFDDDQFIELYQSGLSISKMAKHFGCHARTVAKHIQVLGLQRSRKIVGDVHRRRQSKMIDLKDQIKRLYDEGLSYQAIAKELKCDDTRVCKLVKKWGWNRQRKFRPFLLNDHQSEIIELLNQNVSVSTIAKQYNVSVVTVRNAMKRWSK